MIFNIKTKKFNEDGQNSHSKYVMTYPCRKNMITLKKGQIFIPMSSDTNVRVEYHNISEGI